MRLVREYDLTVAELFPDGVPLPPRALASGWPDDWDEERRAAFYLNDRASRNPFEESSFLRDFEGECDRSTLTARVVDDG